jgi:hypothetical protein
MYVGWSVEEENILTVDVMFIRSTVVYVKQYSTASELRQFTATSLWAGIV